ncbi:O-antigen ligase family protein [Chlamydiota bacterium]
MKQEKRLIKLIDTAIEFLIYGILFVVIFSRALLELFLALTIILWVIKIVLLKKLSIEKPRLAILIPFLFVISGSFSLYNSTHVLTSLRELLNMVEYFLLFFIISQEMAQEERLKKIVFVGIFVLSIISLDALFQFFSGTDFLRLRPSGDINGHKRLTASFSHPNNLGGFIAITLPILMFSLLYYPFKTTRFSKRMGIMLLLFILVFITAMTYSRGTWLALFLAFLLFFSLRDFKMLFAGLLLLGIISFFIPGFLSERIKDIFNIHNITSQMRLDTWKKALELSQMHPIIGNGLKSFSKIYEGGYVHNCYLQLLAEMGIIGLVLFIWFIFYFIVYNIKSFFISNTSVHKIFFLALASGLVAYATHSFIDTNLFSMPLAITFWYFLGINVAYIHYINVTTN